MVFDPDHMSVVGRDEALDIVEAEEYPGLISSHSWSTAQHPAADLPAGRRDHALRRVLGELRPPVVAPARREGRAGPPVLRRRLRRRHERIRLAGRAARPRHPEPGHLPVPLMGRQGDRGAAGVGRQGIRHQHRRGRPLRALPRLGPGPAEDRRRPDHRGHGPRRRGIPPDVGADRRASPRSAATAGAPATSPGRRWATGSACTPGPSPPCSGPASPRTAPAPGPGAPTRPTSPGRSRPFSTRAATLV